MRTPASRKRVWAVMRRLGLVLPAPEHWEERARLGTVAVPESNRRWATDLTTVWTRRDGLVAVVPVIDCGDRTVLDYEVTTSQESPAILAPLARALEDQFGRRRTCQMGLSFEATMARSTREGTARSCASGGAWITPSLPLGVRRIPPSLSDSS